MTRPRLVLAALLAAFIAAPATALAAVDTPWTALSAKAQSSIQQPAIVAVSDASSQVLYFQPNADGKHADMFARRVSFDGQVGAPVPVASFEGFDDPNLIETAGGLLAVLPGLNQPAIKNVATAVAPLDGSQWTLTGGDAAPLPAPFYANSAGLALDATGTPFLSGGANVHRGLDPNTPNSDFQATIGGGCCAYDSDLALDDVTQELFLAWYSNAPQQGVWVHQVDAATGAPADQPMLMPGSVVNFEGKPNSSGGSFRTPITGRAGQPGVFVAWPGGYPTQHSVLLWQVGTAQSRRLLQSTSATVEALDITSDPAGCLWAVWSERSKGGIEKIVARRSNAAATKFGARRVVALPKGAQRVHSLSVAAGQNGMVSIAANLEIAPGANRDNQTWLTELQPQLTYAKLPKKLKHGKPATLTLHVTDAGDPVEGVAVLVKQGNKAVSGVTNATGDLSLAVPSLKKGVAKLSLGHALYAAINATIRVK